MSLTMLHLCASVQSLRLRLNYLIPFLSTTQPRQRTVNPNPAELAWNHSANTYFSLSIVSFNHSLLIWQQWNQCYDVDLLCCCCCCCCCCCFVLAVSVWQRGYELPRPCKYSTKQARRPRGEMVSCGPPIKGSSKTEVVGSSPIVVGCSMIILISMTNIENHTFLGLFCCYW